MKQTTYSTASVARMELRGIRGLWLATMRRLCAISPDSAALHPGYAAMPALAVDPCESARKRGLPLSQRGNEGDLATLASASASAPPPNPPLKKGGTSAPTSSTANANTAGYADARSRFHATPRLAPKQTGAALITSLVFLTVLTILGMSTLGTALLESRMAGNARDRNLAFQAAEIGLRDAELFIRYSGRIVENIVQEMTGDSNSDYSGTTCRFGVCYNGTAWNSNGTNWIAKPVWDNFWANAIQYQHANATNKKAVGSAGATLLVYNPAYALPAGLPLVSRQPEYLIESFSPKPLNDHYYYRITVRGYGMRPGTRVMLQEVYTPN